MEVKRNNPSGDAKEYDNNLVVYFNVLMALLDLNNFVEDKNNDDALSPALGLLANWSNAVALTTVGRSANGVEYPPALAAPLGPPANLSNLSGDNDALGTGHGVVDGTPVGDGTTSVNGVLGSPANGSAEPLALAPAPFTLLGSDAPPALTTALGPLVDAIGLSEGHNAMDKGIGGNIDAPVDNGATGNCVPGLTANGGVDPPESPAGPNGLVTGSDAPPEFSMDACLPVDKHGLSEVGNVMDTGFGGINDAPTQQSAALYPLFYCRNAEMGRQLVAAVGGTRTAPRASPPLAALAALPVNADQDAAGIFQAGGVVEGVDVRTLGSLQAGGTTEGGALCAPAPLPSHATVEATEMAAALVARPGTAVCMDGCAGVTCVDGRDQTFVPAAITVATALAVASPYLNSARSTAADMGRVDGEAIGGEDACAYALTATAGTAAEGDAPPAGRDMQGAHGHFMPHTFTEEELHEADLRLRRLTAADWRLLGILGDTIHLNDGTHLDGGIADAEGAKWQRLCNHVAACSLPLYNLPNGQWAHRFLTMLTDLLGWSDSAALELGAAVGIPGGHPLLHPWNHPIPRCQTNHLGSARRLGRGNVCRTG